MARHSPLEVSITTVLADRWRLGLGVVGVLESLHLKMVDTDVSLFFSFSILTIMYSCLSYPLRTDKWGENPKRFGFGQCYITVKASREGEVKRVCLLCVFIHILNNYPIVFNIRILKDKMYLFTGMLFFFLQSRLRSLSAIHMTGISVSFQTATSHKQCQKYSLLGQTIYSYLLIYF